jgi:hypothetical protein
VLGSEEHVLVVVVPNADEGVVEVGEEAAEGEWDTQLWYFFVNQDILEK